MFCLIDCNGGEGRGEGAREEADGGGEVEGEELWERGEPDVVGVEGVVADC